MIAIYFIIDDFLLNQLQRLDTDSILDKIEELLENDDLYPSSDIDTIWNGLYYLISKEENPVYDKEDFTKYAKSSFIFGDMALSKQEHITYLKHSEIKDILNEIEKIDFKTLSFEPKEFDKKQIFPNIWLKEDKEVLQEELEMAFDELKNLYNQAINTNKNILVTIL